MSDISIAVDAKVAAATAGLDRVIGKVETLKRRGAGGGSGGVLKGVLGANAITAGVSTVVGGLTRLVTEAKNAGSDLQQSTGGAAAVFGKHTREISKAAKSAAQDVGLSRNQYQELATVLGAGLKNQGIKDYAKQTKNVTALGADLAAQYGGDTKTAVEAIGSLMRGESDPIERYGVSINETAVNSVLAAKGQTKLKGAALQTAKAQARLGLLFKQTKDAQGAFSREADTYAGKQQRNAAQIENVKARLGTAILPLATAFQTALATKVLPAVTSLVEGISARLPAAIAAGKVALAAIGQFVAPVVSAVRGIAAAFQGGGGAGSLQTYVAGLQGVFGAVLPIIRSVLTTVLSVVTQMAPTIRGIVSDVGEALGGIASIIQSVWGKLGPIVLPVLKSVLSTVVAVVGGAVKIVANVIKLVAAVLRGDWSGAWKAAGNIVQAVVGIVKALIGNLIAQARVIAERVPPLVKGAWQAVLSATRTAWAAIKSAVMAKAVELVAKVRELPGKIKAGLGNLAGLLVDAGRQVVAGFISGIAGSLGNVVAKAREIASSALNAAKSALGIASPSKKFRQIGRWVGDGFSDGLHGSTAQVRAASRKLAGQLEQAFIAKGATRKAAEKAAAKIVKSVAADTRKLERLAAARAKVAGQLQAANAKLADLRKTAADYAANVTSSARSYASLAAITAPENASLNATILVQGLRDKLAAVVNFTKQLDALRKKGLNATSLDQIIGAGVEQGSGLSAALSTATPAALAEINRLQAAINGQTKTLGAHAADSLYGAGIQAQAGLVRGLAAKSAALDQAADRLADQLVKRVKKKLGIKSPSRVFAGLGQQSVDGLVIGLDDRRVTRQGEQLAGALLGGFSSPQLSASLAGGGAIGGRTYKIEISVPRGVNGAEIGRELVGYIKDFERKVGR